MHLAAKQTFVDVENPTVDELESQILLRYKLMGITDLVLLNNARKEAIKILNKESGEREDYSLDTMEFVVDVNDHDSLKSLLEWQLENFEEFIDAVSENYGMNYGYIDEEGNFTEHEDDDIETYQNEEIVYREAAKYEDLRPLIEEFVNKTNEINQNDRPRYKNEETPFAASVAFQLAMCDVKYLRNYIDYCNFLEDVLRHYYDRYRELGHIPQLFAKYGFDKNEPLVVELIAAQMLMRDNQHIQEELSFLMQLGLEEAIEDEELLDAIFKAAIKRGRELVEYYSSNSITGWLARDLSESLGTMGQDSNKSAIEDLITSEDEIPSFKEFQKMIDGMDDDDDDDDNSDDDDDGDKPKFKTSEYKQFTKDLGAMDFEKVQDGINKGMPLNEYEYKNETALDYFRGVIDFDKRDDKEYMKKVDDMIMLLINNGAEASITDYNLILTAYVFDLQQTLNHFISQGFDINETIDSNGQNILSRNIYMKKLVKSYLEKARIQPCRIPL